MVKNPPANEGNTRDMGFIPGIGIGHPLQYSCLENSMDRGAWLAEVHEVTKSQTRLKEADSNVEELEGFEQLLKMYLLHS